MDNNQDIGFFKILMFHKDMYEFLEKEAIKHNLSVSQFLAKAIDFYLSSGQAKLDQSRR